MVILRFEICMGIHFRLILVSSKDPHVRDTERKAQGGLFDQRCTVLGKQIRATGWPAASEDVESAVMGAGWG